DIHDDHRQPLAEYNRVAERLRALTTEYERNYGPLMPYGQSPVQRWAWTDEPWPWEM
ncbi:MAG: spore coat protein CotJB, partial [Clostridia bacterium]|nr:spore coat protein CotJB [Clostridia bacterium]